MNTKSILLVGCATLSLTTIGLAQGADLCTNAQAISGLGAFSLDTTLALTDGTPPGLCGTLNIENDVWYSWVAPTAATLSVDTCGQAGFDTMIAIYDGSCAGTVLACNDDNCGLESGVSWQGIAGQTYLIRVGNYPGGLGGAGTITISENVPTLNPANGFHYQIIDSPGTTWPQAMADAAAMSFLGVQGHLATLTDQQENDFIYTLGSVHYHFLGGFQNLSSPSYSEPGGGWEWITGEPWSFTNWWPGEPNNSGTTGAEDYLECLHGGQFGQSWNDVQNQHPLGFVVEFETGPVAGPGMAYCFGDGTGASCPCSAFGGLGQGCANTTGLGAMLVASGSASLTNDTFQIDISGVPGAKPGLVLRGDLQVAIPAGDGILCTSGGSMRSHVQVTVAGSTTFTDFNGGPFGAVSNIGAPTTYQFWYRDPSNTCSGSGFNFTNGWTVDYQP